MNATPSLPIKPKPAQHKLADGGMPDAITTHGRTKYYDRRPVVDSLNLRVPYGSVYGFLGRNGAGKSTAIKMLMGMVRPNHGRAKLLGEDADKLRPETRSRIAYLAEGHPRCGPFHAALLPQLER